MFDCISTNEVWGQRSKLQILPAIKPSHNTLNLTQGLSTASKEVFREMNISLDRLKRKENICLGQIIGQGSLNKAAIEEAKGDIKDR